MTHADAVPQFNNQGFILLFVLRAAICVTVTLLDGLVLARSQFNTDMVKPEPALHNLRDVQ